MRGLCPDKIKTQTGFRIRADDVSFVVLVIKTAYRFLFFVFLAKKNIRVAQREQVAVSYLCSVHIMVLTQFFNDFLPSLFARDVHQ